MPEPRTIWKRRAVLMAAVGLVVAIPLTIAIAGGDDNETPPAPAEPELPEVGEVEFDRKLGVELRVPEGWETKRKHAAITYTSPDRSLLISVSAPGPAQDAEVVQREAVAAIEQGYRRVEVLDRTQRERLGDRPASAAVLSARPPDGGDEFRILVATAKGEKQAYLVEVFALDSSALVEAQVLLNNLRLEG